MEVTSRSISADEIEGSVGLRSLRDLIGAELLGERGGALFLAVSAATLHQMTAAVSLGKALLLGAFGDGALIGWTYVRREVLPDGRMLGVMDELGVHPDGRGIGVGEVLLEAALAWCRSQECIGVDSFALPGARETKNFFETFGLKARLLTVHVSFLEIEPKKKSYLLHGRSVSEGPISASTAQSLLGTDEPQS